MADRRSASKPGATLSIDFKAWHIWQNTHGRIMAIGPDPHNRLFDFDTPDDAVTWLYLTGHKEVARRLNSELTH